ncbi:MAG: diguanylate cyclase [Syntrophaceae bacterium]|nr:diguanylate cyclase [Syntrophaceae bacterium]
MKDEAKTKTQLIEELDALRRQIEEDRRRAGEASAARMAEKAGWERREKLLREMGRLLRSCGVAREGLAVIQLFGPQLFPGSAGAFFLHGNAVGDMEAAVAWGPDLQSESVFPREDCWALRSGRTHRVDFGPSALRCRHMKANSMALYFDVPVVDEAEGPFLLHLEYPGDPSAVEPDLHELAASVAERMALSLSGLKMREKLKALFIRDPLTGLFNRGYGEEALGLEIFRAARRKGPVGLVAANLDHFEKFNHMYGYEEGDALLRELGEVIRHQVRGGDIPCRWEGDSFIVIMPEAPLETARNRAERIREAIGSLVVVTGQKKKPFDAVTASFGIAAYPDYGKSADDLLRMADKAVFQAKREGGNRVAVARMIPPPE